VHTGVVQCCVSHLGDWVKPNLSESIVPPRHA
jgi:hypothetical protein